MSAVVERVPPQNLEAEQSVLGAMLIDPDAIARVAETLREEDFYRDANRRVFRAILNLWERGEAADLVTVTEELSTQGALEDVGGASYVATLASAVPTAANVEYYARIVEEKALLRQLINVATRIVARGYEASEDIHVLLDEAEQAIFQIAQRRSTQGYWAIKDILMDTFERIEHLYANKGGVTGVPTGYKELDEILSGLQPSELIVLAARPSQGKSTLSLGFARNAAIQHRIPVAFFSLEMGREQLAQRLLCAEAQVDSRRLRTGFLTDQDWPKLSHALGRLSEAPIFIDDTPAIGIMELRAKARRMKSEHGVGLIVVDYLQLMQTRGRVESRQQEVSEISRSLKALARELKVPLVACSQLSRAVEQREGRRPQLSDLRECVPGDTLVVLADGRRVPIRDLVGQTPAVISMSPQGRLIAARAERVWCVGRRPLHQVRLARGRLIRATCNHRLLGSRGWCEVGDLRPGDRLALARRLPEPTPTEVWPDAGADSDLFWDRIVSIEPAGEEDVYDLTVPGPASWLADGIVSHNSGAIEQDADVVLFIHFPPNEENKNLAEIIVAKQRNGPTGSVELVFLRDIGKFASLDKRRTA